MLLRSEYSGDRGMTTGRLLWCGVRVALAALLAITPARAGLAEESPLYQPPPSGANPLFDIPQDLDETQPTPGNQVSEPYPNDCHILESLAAEAAQLVRRRCGRAGAHHSRCDSVLKESAVLLASLEREC